MLYPYVDFILLRNTVNITEDIRKYLLSVTVEENFDSDFTPSKIELNVWAKYPGSWAYNDKLFLSIYWNQIATSFISEDFYVDYYDDNRQLLDQDYVVSGIEQDLKLSETFKTDSITLSNNTILIALNSVATNRGLQLFQNATSGIYLGTFPNTTQVSTVTKKFSSYLEVVRYICNTFGYIGNLSGKKLEVYKLSQPGTITTTTPIPGVSRVLSLRARNQVNVVAKQYNARFIDRANGNVETIINLNNSSGVSNKVIDLSDEGIYYNYETAYERTLGRLYQDYYRSFTISLTVIARDYLHAGKYFFLDADFGSYTGYYIALKVTHKAENGSWIADIDAFPIGVIAGINPTFTLTPING
jgi:hypothetical protein